MATAYENVVKHLKLAIRQMEQLTKMETEIDEDEVCDLMSPAQPELCSTWDTFSNHLVRLIS